MKVQRDSSGHRVGLIRTCWSCALGPAFDEVDMKIDVDVTETILYTDEAYHVRGVVVSCSCCEAESLANRRAAAAVPGAHAHRDRERGWR